MPNEKEADDIKSMGATVREMFIGGGLLVYSTTLAFGGIWWAATQDSNITELTRSLDKLEARVDGLDNVSLGIRVAKLEQQGDTNTNKLTKIDDKVDKLIDRLIASHP